MVEASAEIPAAVLERITPEQAWHYQVVPFGETDTGNVHLFALDDRSILRLQDELEFVAGTQVLFEWVTEARLSQLLLQHYRLESNRTQQIETLSVKEPHSLVENLLEKAQSTGSSDIHIECYEDHCRIRIRIDGKLIETSRIDRSEYPSLINKIKVRAQLDIAEKRLPQDGRIHFDAAGQSFDVRVSILPTIYGEKVVMRILSQDSGRLDLDALGMSTVQLKHFKEAIRKPEGIILISGPTGSGKTTTLYSTLKLLNSKAVNISTIEDPIEYMLAGVNQVQVREAIGLTFAAALRSFLRQDPDIIMLGEIRDAETAQMSIRASLTGHLVLSTIHTNSAIDTLARLADMGVQQFLIASTLRLSVAQRLVRLLCSKCKRQVKHEGNPWPLGFKPPTTVAFHFLPGGCEHCHFTGFKGRKAIYEVLPVSTQIQYAIRHGEELHPHLPEDFRPLSMLAFDAVERGETSIEEVYPLLMN